MTAEFEMRPKPREYSTFVLTLNGFRNKTPPVEIHNVRTLTEVLRFILLQRANGDEAEAFRLFFEHFNEYLKDRDTIGPEGIRARCG